MADLTENYQRAIVRDRFTRTAGVFGGAVIQVRAVDMVNSVVFLAGEKIG